MSHEEASEKIKFPQQRRKTRRKIQMRRKIKLF